LVAEVIKRCAGEVPIPVNPDDVSA
jgi:hypothetical protein